MLLKVFTNYKKKEQITQVRQKKKKKVRQYRKKQMTKIQIKDSLLADCPENANTYNFVCHFISIN